MTSLTYTLITGSVTPLFNLVKRGHSKKRIFFCQAGSEFERGQTTNLELCNYLVSTKKFMTTTFTSKLSVILNFYSVKFKIVTELHAYPMGLRFELFCKYFGDFWIYLGINSFY